MCGKPRKLAVLANFAPQVSIRLSQPARMVKPSPSAIARTGASSRVRTAMPSVTSWPSTSARRPAFAPLVHSMVPKVNQPEVEAAEPRGGEGPIAQQIDHGARTLVGRVLEIDAAARIAERGVAGRLEGPPDRLAQHMGERADLSDEGEPPAPDLADGPAPHQHALARCRPSSPARPRPRRCPSGRRGCRSR
jgi:hypothetical protein